MKKKLLSLFLALSMLLTSVLCLLPVAAEDNPDAEALKYNSKFVCRVGTADEAKANDYAGYYTSTKTAMDAAFKDKKDTTVTITLIADDSTVGETLVVTSGNTLILNGRKSDTENFTYTSKGGFRVNGGNVTVKNLNVVVTAGTAKQAIGGLHTAHTMTFENCDIRGGSAYDRTDNGLFYVAGGVKATLNIINCTIGIDKKDLWNGDKMTDRHLFVNFAKGEATLNLNHVKIDVSDVTNANGISWTGGTVNISDSTISVNCNGISAAQVLTMNNSTLTAGQNAFDFSKLTHDVSMDFYGKTEINATNRAFSITNNEKAVKVTAGGKTVINATAKKGNAIYVCGNNKNASFTLTLQDNASLSSAKDVMSFEHGSMPITKATISFLDHATVKAPNGWLLHVAKRPVTYNISDNATIETKNFMNNGTYKLDGSDEIRYDTDVSANVTTNNIYTPKMGFGASVRLVENSSGLRFSSTLAIVAESETFKRKGYGTLIAIYDELGENDFTIAALEAAGIEFANIPATKDGTVAGDGFNTYNAALTNIPAEYGDTKFVARAYAIYEINGVEYYVYADFSEDNVRDFYDVCNKALKDVKTNADFEKDENLRTEYPFEITTGKWSPYTKAQRELLDSLIPDDKKKQ